MNTVILGIGNTLKGDDGIGPYIISKLSAKHHLQNVHLIDAGTVPENYIQKIIDLNPDKIMIIDAVDFKGEPGRIKKFKEIESANISISTHNTPPELFISLLKQETNAEIEIIAIQPKQLKLDKPLSEEIKKSADTLMEELCTKYIQ